MAFWSKHGTLLTGCNEWPTDPEMWNHSKGAPNGLLSQKRDITHRLQWMTLWSKNVKLLTEFAEWYSDPTTWGQAPNDLSNVWRRLAFRWQKGTSPKLVRRILEDRWKRATLLRFSILPSLQGNLPWIIISVKWKSWQFCGFRPEDRVNRLAEQLANSEGKIGENVSKSSGVKSILAPRISSTLGTWNNTTGLTACGGFP